MRGTAISGLRSASGPAPSSKPSVSDTDSLFDAALNTALHPTKPRTQPRDRGNQSVEREQSKSREEEPEKEEPPTALDAPVVFPFALPPTPLPLLAGDLTLLSGLPEGVTGEPLAGSGDTSASGGGIDGDLLPQTPGPAALAAEGMAALDSAEQPAEATSPPSADGKGENLDALLAEFTPPKEEVALPPGLKPQAAVALPTGMETATNSVLPDFTAATANEASEAAAAPVERHTAPAQNEKPAPEIAIEKLAAPDEGMMEGLRSVSTPRQEPNLASIPQGESQPVSATTLRELPAQVARLSTALVRELAGDGVKEIRIRLDPPSLGEIRVQVESDQGKLRIHVVAASPETAALLADGQSNLRDELARQGMALANFSTGTEPTFDFSSAGGFTPRERGSEPGTGRSLGRTEEPVSAATPVRRASAGRLDARA